MKRTTVTILVLTLFVQNLISQTTKEELFNNLRKTAGVYYAYPSQEITNQTPAPEGYKPFYISHFGRHGSRYLINDDDYKTVLNLFDDAYKHHALSPLGLDVHQRLSKLWKEVEWRGGDLSSVGVREQRGIAERMYRTYPEIFSDSTKISATSTTYIRCALSMDAFSERLKELNPMLQITRESSIKHQRYINNHTKEALEYRSAKDTWHEEYLKFEEAHIQPTRLVSSLFSDSLYIVKNVNLRSLMTGLFYIAGGMQNVETDLSFYDLFEKDELFDLWQCQNYRLYVKDANYPFNHGIMFENAKPLLRNMLDSAKQAIATNGKGASLRFGHDGNIIPLALLLHLDNCYNSVAQPNDFYKAWSDFKVAPMGGNIQMIFFRKRASDDLLVKFLLHEKETLIPPIKTAIAPYYRWKDVEQYYESLLKND